MGMRRGTQMHVTNIHFVFTTTDIWNVITRRHLERCIYSPRHTKLGTMLLPVSSRYISFDISALHHNWFSHFQLGWTACNPKLPKFNQFFHSPLCLLLKFHENHTNVCVILPTNSGESSTPPKVEEINIQKLTHIAPFLHSTLLLYLSTASAATTTFVSTLLQLCTI